MDSIDIDDNNYNFEKILSVPIIFNQILKFLDKERIKKKNKTFNNYIKNLSVCNKKIYKLYCNEVKKLKINKGAEILNLKIIFDKYENVNSLDLSYCENIKDFNPISKRKIRKFKY